MTDNWLSNTYLVAAGPKTDAFLVDAGGPMDPLFAKADEHGLSVTLFEAHGFGRWGLLPKVCEMDGKEHDVLILGKRL